MNNSNSFIRNIRYNVFAELWLILLTFLATPYMVRLLGTEAYGIIVLTNTIIGFSALAQGGIGESVVKHVSSAYTKKDRITMNGIINTAVSFSLFIGIVGLIVLLFVSKLLTQRILKISPALVNVATQVILLSGLGFLFTTLNLPLNAILRALQRFDLYNIIRFIQYSLWVIGTLVLVLLSFHLRTIISYQIGIVILTFGLYFIVVKKLLPELKIRINLQKVYLIPLLSFGIFIFIGQISGMVITQLDKFIIGSMVSVKMLPYYSIPFTIAQKLTTIPLFIMPVLFPKISELSTLQQDKTIEKIYLQGNKFVIFATLPFVFLSFLFAKYFLLYWLGHNFAQNAALPLQLLSLTFFFAAITGIPSSLVFGKGYPQLGTLGAFITTILTLIGWFVFIPLWGINGACFGMALAYSISALIFLIIVEKKFFDRLTFIKKDMFIIGLVGLFLLLLFRLINVIPKNLYQVFIYSTFFLGLHCFINYLIIFNREEKKILVGFLTTKSCSK